MIDKMFDINKKYLNDIYFDKNWCGNYSIRFNYGQKNISRKSRVWGAQGTLMYLRGLIHEICPQQKISKSM